jgi:protein TonB
MLNRLVASNRPRNGLWRTPGAAISVGVHGLLIVGAVVVTRPEPASHAQPVRMDTTIWDIPADQTPASPHVPRHQPFSAPVFDQPVIDDLRLLEHDFPVAVPAGIPDPGFRVPGGTPRSGSARQVPWPWGSRGGSDTTAPIPVAAADEAPELLTFPAPVYPAMLREAGIQGTVVLEFVVDPEGRPEMESVRPISSAHELFEAAARRVVQGARYRPGRWHGRPVRVLIRQPVEFRLR